MPQPFKLTYTEDESLELRLACAARLRELDKAFKACSKADAGIAKEKVMDRVAIVRKLLERINESLQQ